MASEKEVWAARLEHIEDVLSAHYPGFAAKLMGLKESQEDPANEPAAPAVATAADLAELQQAHAALEDRIVSVQRELATRRQEPASTQQYPEPEQRPEPVAETARTE